MAAAGWASRSGRTILNALQQTAPAAAITIAAIAPLGFAIAPSKHAPAIVTQFWSE